MKKFQFAATTIFILFGISCTGPNRDHSSNNSSFFGDNTKTHEYKDANTGLTVFSIDYPSSWKVASRPTYKTDRDFPVFDYRILGPDGLIAFNKSSGLFVSYSDPQVTYYSRMIGTKNIRPVVSIQQLIQQDIEPIMRSQGYSYSETRNFPELERYINRRVMEKALVPAQSEFIATLWNNGQGQQAMVFINRAVITQSMGQYGTQYIWTYSTDYLIANSDSFENHVAESIKAKLNIKDNPQWSSYKNKLIAQKTKAIKRQDAIAHNERMARLRGSIDSHQKNMKSIWETQDANHAAFMERNFGSSGSSPGSSDGQRDFLNMINEEETVYNPEDGKNYQINTGSKEYWMDGNGNQIQSDDLFFNPNADTNFNQSGWSKVWEDY